MAWESWNGILQVRFFSEKFPFKSFQTVKFIINQTILGWIDLKKSAWVQCNYLYKGPYIVNISSFCRFY